MSKELINGATKITVEDGFNSGVDERIFGGVINEVAIAGNSIIERGKSYAVTEIGGRDRLCGYDPDFVDRIGTLSEGGLELVKEIGEDLKIKSFI